MIDSQTSVAQLKRRLEQLERPHRREASLFSLGYDALDARLGGGLVRGALHELCAAEEGDHSAASGFALMLAIRASAEKPILWIREDRSERMHGQLYAPGMIDLGAAPERVTLVCAPDTLSALRAGADSISIMGLGTVVIEPFGAAKALDLTASRKLVLAAERSGVTAFILREGGSSFSSAASTRWGISSATSTLLAGQAPSHTCLAVNLLRHRGSVAPFSMTIEWNSDEKTFRKPALSGALLSAAECGQMVA